MGVSLTSVTLVLDNALIGLLRGGVQLWRNLVFALGKLVALWLIVHCVTDRTGMGIYNTWTMGNVISLGILIGFIATKKPWGSKRYHPQWSLLRKLGGAALQHHLLNLVISAPTLLLPVIVTIMFSAKANAWFYVAWMVANFVFVVPSALTIVLHALNSAQKAALKQRAQVTLSIAFATITIAICVILFGAKEMLSFFGNAYAAEATGTLQLLALGGLPLIIESHYIAICRIHDRIKQALVVMILGSLLQLAGAAFGGYSAGLVGLSIGWVGGLVMQSLFMLPTIYKAVFTKQADGQQTTVEEAIWLMETNPLPAMGSGGIEGPWLMDTLPVPAIKSYTRQ